MRLDVRLQERVWSAESKARPILDQQREGLARRIGRRGYCQRNRVCAPPNAEALRARVRSIRGLPVWDEALLKGVPHLVQQHVVSH